MTAVQSDTQRNLTFRVFWLALPAIGEMVLHMVIWIVDTAMVGRLGAPALSAVGLGGQIYFTSTFVLGSLGMAVTAMVARRTGEGRKDDVPSIAGQAMAMAMVMGLALTGLLLWLAPPLFRLADLGAEAAAMGTGYLRTLAPGGLAIMTVYVGNGALRGTGDTKTPLVMAAASNLINIVLDYGLIFGHFGLPALGVRGAALASLTAQTCGFLMMVVAARRMLGVRLRHLAQFSLANIKSLIRLSAPAAAEVALMDGARMVNSFVIAGLGATAFAAHQITVATESLSFMPGYGFSLAAAIMVGQALGARDVALARKSAWRATSLAAGIMCLAGLAFLLIPRHLLWVFTADFAVITTAVLCLQVAALAQPFMAVTETLSGGLRGAGDTRGTMQVTAGVVWLVRVPLTLLVVRGLGLGLAWVWLVILLEWAIRAVLIGRRFQQGRWAELQV